MPRSKMGALSSNCAQVTQPFPHPIRTRKCGERHGGSRGDRSRILENRPAKPPDESSGFRGTSWRGVLYAIARDQSRDSQTCAKFARKYFRERYRCCAGHRRLQRRHEILAEERATPIPAESIPLLAG